MNHVIKLFNLSRNKRVNTRLIGKYLGEGDEGEVFAYDKDKIIKVIEVFKNKNYAKLLTKRLRYLKSLNSKHIAKLFDYGYISCDGYYTVYYISERLFYTATPNSKWELDSVMNSFGKLYYYDFHDENIMQTKTGTQKIADLTGFEPKWINTQ